MSDDERGALARDLLRQKKIFPEVVAALTRRGATAEEAALVVARTQAEIQRASDLQIGWTSLGASVGLTLLTVALSQATGFYVVALGGLGFGLTRLVRGLTTDPSQARPDAGFRAWAEDAAEEGHAKRAKKKGEGERGDANEARDALPKVKLEIVEEPAGPQHPVSEIRARSSGLGTFDLWVKAPGPLARLTARLGFGAPLVDDAEFLRRYAVETNDLDLARAWLTPEVRAALLDALAISFRALNDQVVTRVSRALLESSHLRATLDATTAFAQGPARIAGGVGALARALGATASSWSGDFGAWPSFVWELAPATISVELVQGPPPSVRRRAPVFTCVEVDRRGGAPFALCRAGAEPALEAHASLVGTRSTFGAKHALRVGEGALEASARAELERLASEPDVVAVVRDEETVTVLLAGIALDAELHRRTAAAAVNLASPPSLGPYR